MRENLKNNSDIKLDDSIEMEKFNQEKLKHFIMNRDSRPSDPENPDIFRPTAGIFKEEGHSFDHDAKMKQGI
jgi:hypothetical protein